MGRTTEKIIIRNYVDVVKASEGTINNVIFITFIKKIETYNNYISLNRNDV